MPRVFVGTFLPEDGRASVGALARDNSHLSESWHTKVRWVDQSKLHMTWIFLGDIQDDLIPEVSTALGKAVGRCRQEGLLDIEYDRFELWPNERKARLGVITPSMVPNQIITVDKTLKEALRAFLPKSERQNERTDFRPHITILRFPHHKGKDSKKPRPGASIKDVVIGSAVFPLIHPIDRIELIASDMGKPQQGYETICAFEL